MTQTFSYIEPLEIGPRCLPHWVSKRRLSPTWN